MRGARLAVAFGAALILLVAGAPAASANRAADIACNKAFPNQFSKTYNIRLGTKRIYNRDASRGLVCNGGFGAPDGYEPTLATACDIILAAWHIKDPLETHERLGQFGCGSLTIHEKGWKRGSIAVATNVACGYVVDLVAVRAGIFVAGLTLNPEDGPVVWKGVTFVGDTVICIGIGKVARSWGERLEGRHEVAVAQDIVQKSKCLQLTKRKIIGLKWSAVDCPNGFRGSKLPALSSGSGPVDDPGGNTPDSNPTPDDPGPVPGSGSTPAATTYPETAGGVAHTWTDYVSAGGSEGPSVAGGQTVGVTCKLQGFRVANGNPWWYRIGSSPWNDGYYVSADAFYNNGQTSGPLAGTPYVDPSVPDCGAAAPPATDTPAGAINETVGGVTHTWTDYSSAGGTQGPSIQTGQTVGVACKVAGFRVADGNTWWYRIASSPWNGAYYASADAFYNNGQTSGPLTGTPFVDGNVPDCFASPPPPPQTWAETTGGVAHTWTNYTNAGGNQGPSIGSNQTVQIACKLPGFRVADGNTWWYRIASSPWNGAYYVSADAFYNNGQTSGPLKGTPFVDPSVGDC